MTDNDAVMEGTEPSAQQMVSRFRIRIMLPAVRDERYESRGSMALQIPLYSVNRKLRKGEREDTDRAL
jgi:hypothetical protein